MTRGARLRAEDGMSMIEVMITMLITLSIIGTMTAFFVNAGDSSLANTRQVNVLALAQQKIENIRQQVARYGFGTLGLTGSITKAGLDTDASNPTDFVTATLTSFEVQGNYDVPGTILATEPLVTGGTLAEITPNVTVGNATATVYTFVTQVNDVCNSALATAGSLCTGTVTAASNSDVRRVVVAVQLDATNQLNHNRKPAPQYLTTVITNPVPSDQVNNALGLRIGLNVS
jgi:type II secretory pathway pseudopilin PulG